MPDADPNAPYATAARLYAEAGWAGVLPLPERKKWPPPKGFTGRGGAYPDARTIDDWVRTSGTGNIGLRLGDDTIGIDVDAYDGKKGDATFLALRAQHGELPPTWTSTSRDDGRSGIRLYRLRTPRTLNDKPGPGIEIIQHHHRYVVVWPSVHPDTGDPYRWITPDGEISDRPPRPDEIPYLPDEWLTGLTPGPRRTLNLPLEPDVGHDPNRWARAVESAFNRAVADMPGGRHDATLHGCAGLVRLRSLDYPGADEALRRLETMFISAVVADGTRSDRDAAGEWSRILEGADKLISSTPAAIRPYADLVAERRNGHPNGGGVRDKLPPAEPSQPTWDEEPTPVGSVRADLPQFPTHVLPGWVTDMAHGVADELQVPVDLPAMLALSALSTLAAGRVKVAVNPSWEEPVNLYLVTAMPPGAGKSPAAKKMLRPVQDYETELIEAAKPLAARYEQEQRIREKEMRRAEDVGDRVKAAELLLEAEMTEPVTVPQLTVDDATHSALVQMLHENRGRGAILSTEGGLFDIMSKNRYNEASDAEFQIYLKGFSGDWHKDRRVGRGATNIPEVTLTIGLVTQPAVIQKLAEKPELAGVGLTARFMYSLPPDMVGWRNFVDAQPVDPSVAERYRKAMLDLARRLGSYIVAPRVRLTSDAADLYLRWHQEMEPRRRKGGDLYPVAEWSEKLRSCVVRVAALLHLADGHDWDDIDAATLRRALDVAGYWLEHAKAVHSLWSTSATSNDAQRVLDWLSEAGIEEFKARDSYRSGPLRDAAAAREVLPMLEEYGWLHLLDGGFGKGNRSPRYAVHPTVTQPATSCHMPGTADVARMWQTESCHIDETNNQVTPAGGDEMDREDGWRRSGVSGLKHISDLSLSPLESARTSGPPATRATAATSSGGDTLGTPSERPLTPCPSCGGSHPGDPCPAEL